MSLKLYRTHHGYGARSNHSFYDDGKRILYKINTPGPMKAVHRVTTIAKVTDIEYISDSNSNLHPAAKEKKTHDLLEVPGEKDSDASSVASSVIPRGKWESDSDSEDNSTDAKVLVSELNNTGSRQTLEYLAQIQWGFFVKTFFKFADRDESVSEDDFFRKRWLGSLRKASFRSCLVSVAEPLFAIGIVFSQGRMAKSTNGICVSGTARRELEHQK
ncbi:hypothetical protein V5O48_004322 [Marasmius crinis-equi]|uniref:Uncharacterized protein n=1 Tax=Marasmius crinis-equi TaxID=585013 RepID=A0ABR3FQJ2_9AGAR